MANGVWSVESQCPQCGSPVTTEETDRIFKCAYCRVRLYMRLPEGECFRYFIPAPKPVKRLFYVPYWRFKGTLFSCPKPSDADGTDAARYEVSHRLIDSSTLAFGNSAFASTLGLRPQVLKLRIAVPDTGAPFLKPDVVLHAAVDRIMADIAAVDASVSAPPPYYREFIGECASLIYTPHYIKFDRIFDAVLDRPLGAVSEAEAQRLLAVEMDEWTKPAFLSTLCPNCGADLEGEAKTLVLACANCATAWHADGDGLKETAYRAMASGEEGVSWLPFWRMKVDVSGVNVKTYADLVKTANLPKIIKEEYKTKETLFWSPAFKISPPMFLRLSQQLTLLQPEDGLFENAGRVCPAYPVTLPVSEAAESVILNLANFISGKRLFFPKLPLIKVGLKEFTLMYVPFVQKGTELLQSRIGFSISKAAADMGGNL